ncbi:hypothetical protein [Streptococcus iniae]|uniref:hypothetical protein n=1 Tax=Streptococcus iniae TaxID=1346 RepID=UPI00160559B5|nr:hypothetical protein [Streptococcus iniae]HEK4517272.1 hypothetical protein [Streptococcus iniae]
MIYIILGVIKESEINYMLYLIFITLALGLYFIFEAFIVLAFALNLIFEALYFLGFRSFGRGMLQKEKKFDEFSKISKR